ncbi:hypothetical protein LRAMOSA08489 [Lichtheimia ramosa]|uniref:Uncharacterized protein n=1 Tax=Lichtheimia ramosa TaxID=688394 RepID=A0A077WEA5_9FUNG|nr:hypothetical protein LRAMOSA08489 [Lichtheimia ramosa]
MWIVLMQNNISLDWNLSTGTAAMSLTMQSLWIGQRLTAVWRMLTRKGQYSITKASSNLGHYVYPPSPIASRPFEHSIPNIRVALCYMKGTNRWVIFSVHV